jgi:hypothetical protein
MALQERAMGIHFIPGNSHSQLRATQGVCRHEDSLG